MRRERATQKPRPAGNNDLHPVVDVARVTPLSHPAFARLDHRPWPLPTTPWIWRQTWHDLLFAHWPVPVSDVRDLVPSRLRIQEHDGTSWVGIVPFHMTGVTLRGVPPLPALSSFAEMNLRLYVDYRDRPGVWFISLDAASALAAWAARVLVSLPYFTADIAVNPGGDRIVYRAERRPPGAPVRFDADYGPVDAPREARPGTLEHFLTERYCLYAQNPAGELKRLEIHHAPWPLQRASAVFRVNAVAEPQGVRLPDVAPLLHFSRLQEVVGWGSEIV